MNASAWTTRSRLGRFSLVFVCFLAPAPVVSGCDQRLTQVVNAETGYHFPKTSDIASMKYVDPLDEHDDADLPEESWAEIIAALSPSQYDPRPDKWPAIGSLVIRTKDKETRWIRLFVVKGEAVGAFAAGPSWKERTYYRGGNSARLESAIRKALSKVKKRQAE